MAYAAQSDLVKILPLAQLIELCNDNDMVGQINAVAGYAIGVSTGITFDGLTTVPTDGDKVKFGSHNQTYTVSSVTATTFTVSPALVAAIVDNEDIILLDTVNTTNSDQGRIDAESTLNSLLQGRYTTPLTTPSQEAINFTVRLWRDNLYDRRGLLVAERYDAHLKLIDEIKEFVKGSMTMDANGEASASSEGVTQTNKVTSDRYFTSTVLDGLV